MSGRSGRTRRVCVLAVLGAALCGAACTVDSLGVAADTRAAAPDQVTIENAGISHAHAMHPQQVMWLWAEQSRIEPVMRFDMFLGQHGTAGGNPAYQRQAQLLTQRILELDAS